MSDIKRTGGIHCLCFYVSLLAQQRGFDYWEEMGGEEDL